MKKMSREKLVRLFVEERKKTDELNAEIEKLTAKLEDKNVAIGRAGSIADAALSLSGVFEAAQDACDRYVGSVEAAVARRESESAERDAMSKKRAEELLNEAMKGSEAILKEAVRQGEAILAEAKRRAGEIEREAKEKTRYD